MIGRGAAALAIAAAAACSSDRPTPAPAANTAPAARPGEWRCYVMDPKTPVIDAGNVTHSKERLLPDRFEIANVAVRHGVAGAARFTYTRAGDHYESTMGAGTLTLRLLAPDGSHTIVSYQDPDGWTFTDETVVDDRGKTITSTDTGADGKPIKTTIQFVTAPCYVVDAELAKYPA